MQARCSGRTKTGEACKAPAQAGSRWCVSHDPGRVTDLAAWRRQGGKAKSNQARARKAIPGGLTASDLHRAMSGVFARVVKGQMEPGVGVAAMTIAKGLVDLHRAAELEATVADLARRLGERPA